MKKVAVGLAVAALAAVVAVVILVGGPRGPSLSDLEHLKEPRITTIPPSKVLVVTAKGNPNVVGSRAFGLLMRAYFGLKGVPRGPGMPAPRVRWSGDPVTPEQWIGHYAIPVPQEVSSLGKVQSDGALTVEPSTWEYGKVAEILHVGRYDKESATVQKLKSFILDQGYEIDGDHEEEYLRGPGMWFRGNPDTYLTVIRYPVRRKPVDR